MIEEVRRGRRAEFYAHVNRWQVWISASRIDFGMVGSPVSLAGSEAAIQRTRALSVDPGAGARDPADGTVWEKRDPLRLIDRDGREPDMHFLDWPAV